MSAGRFKNNLAMREKLDAMLGSINKEFPELEPFDVSLQEFKIIHQKFENTENSMFSMRNAVIDRLEQEKLSLEKSHFLAKKELKKNLSPMVELLVFKKHYQKIGRFSYFYEIQNSASLSIDDKMLYSYLFLKDYQLLLTMIQQNKNKLIPDLEDQQSALRQITDFLVSINIAQTAGRVYNVIELENLIPLEKNEFSRKIQEMLTKQESFVTIIETLTKEILKSLLEYLRQTFENKEKMPLTCGQLLSAAIQSFVFKTEGASHIQQVLELEISKQIQTFVRLIEQEERESSDGLDTFESIMGYIKNLTLDEEATKEQVKVKLSEKCVSKVRDYVSFLYYFPGKDEVDRVKTIINNLNPEDRELFLKDLSNHPEGIAERLGVNEERTASPVSIAGHSSPALFSSKQQNTSSRSSSPTPSSER